MSYICFFEGYMKDFKPNWLLFNFVVLVVVIIGCISDGGLATDKDVGQRVDSISNWLLNDKNYADRETYRKVFLKHFDEAIGQKNYGQAKKLLLTYGDMLFSFYAYDSLYHPTLDNFISKYNQELANDTISSGLFYYQANKY